MTRPRASPSKAAPRDSPEARALAAVLRLTATPRATDRANRALTLHLLRGHAPAFFRAHRLAVALEASLDDLARIPASFPPSLSPDAVMARLDALYLRALHLRPLPVFDPRAVRRHVHRLRDGGLLLPAWLFAGLASRLGVACDVPLPARFPWRASDPETHAYHLTHELLLRTDFLMRSGRRRGLAPVLDALEAALPWCLSSGQWDALGEVAFCLQFGGRRVPPRALAALRAAQTGDGRVVEAGAPASLHAHSTAAALVALAWRR